MNKYLLMKIADILINSYGHTLMEGETDIKMAKSVMRILPNQIPILSQLLKINDKYKNQMNKDYIKWKTKRMVNAGLWRFETEFNYITKESTETGYLTDGLKRWKYKP
jgi:hypothetical protein